MTIVVEDGSGKTDAVSYCSAADADAFHLARGNAAWADLDPADKESALVRATDHMLEFYRGRWKGVRTNTTQALDWPRSGVIIDDGQEVEQDVVLPEVKNACAMLALKASAEDLAPDLDRETSREKIDVLEFEYRPGSQIKKYRSVDALLSPLLIAGGASISILRA
jgi:hypothetical protein